MSAKLQNISRWIFWLSGWLAAVAVGVLHLPAEINSFFVEAPKSAENISNLLFLNTKLTGTWTSDIEGWINATDEDRRLSGGDAGPLVMTIRVYGGDADGEIVSEGLKKHYVFSRIMFKGREQGGQVEGVAFDYVDGKPMALAKIQISHLGSDGDNTLRFKTLEQPDQFFPAEARLHRDANAMPDNLGELNMELLKSVIKPPPGTKTDPKK